MIINNQFTHHLKGVRTTTINFTGALLGGEYFIFRDVATQEATAITSFAVVTKKKKKEKTIRLSLDQVCVAELGNIQRISLVYDTQNGINLSVCVLCFC